MNFWTLVLRSLSAHWRSHLGAYLGATLACAVLVGALIVGDSVRGSLRSIALQRLGKTEFALPLGDRLVRAELASELAAATKSEAVGLLQMPGTATASESQARANQVQVLGVSQDFWPMAGHPGFPVIAADEVHLNNALARQLKVRPGDSITLRIRKPTQLSQDAPLSPTEDTSIALRLTVKGVGEDVRFGRFSLQASQLPPLNAFVSLTELQRRLGLTNRVNLILSSGLTDPKPLEQAIAQVWQPLDAQLHIHRPTNTQSVELRSPRVFIEEPVADAVHKLGQPNSRLITYLVNELRHGTNATPYSMVTAAEPPLLPILLKDDEILVNQWLADDLHVQVGDTLTLKYYVVGPMRSLVEATNSFTIRGILPMTGPTADPTLMPDFPGMTDADNCRDWDTGFAIQTDRIRDKDEKYWDTYRGTPKAFVSLAKGQAMWGNRFGSLTAVRFADSQTEDGLWSALRQQFSPPEVGLRVEPVRQQALAASDQAQDFGQLFLGFSFFLILTALMLMGLLFQLGLEQRSKEVGLFLALGYEPKQVRRVLLGEGFALAALGAATGAILGMLYARAMLHGLRTIWSDAIGSSTILEFHANPLTIAIGALSGLFAAVAALWLTLRKQGRQSARQLLDESSPEVSAAAKPGTGKRWLVVGAVIAVSAIAVAIWSFARDEANGPAFFGIGALLLVAALLISRGFLVSSGKSVSQLDLLRLGFRNISRRPKRSLTSIGLLASGAFVIASIGVFRLDSTQDADKRSSGTGGFAFLGESSIPVVHDLNSADGRDFYGLNARTFTNAQIVQLRVRPGDDASCLNLNRAQRPRLVGVNPARLSDRGAFTFSKVADGFNSEEPWLSLSQPAANGAIPAIGDAASIQWALGKKVGDTLPYTDERGQTFQIQLVGAVANSILQGNLLIAEDHFTRLFPGESGYRMFFIDVPSNEREAVANALNRSLADVGLELVSAPERLAAFNAVQNTYLSTFQLLGGLGLILGSAGLAIILLRNVLERQGEFAVMQAVGFDKQETRRMTITEHSALLIAGLLAGIIPAIVAVIPALSSQASAFPWRSLGLTLGAVLLNGLIWTWIAARVALRRPFLETLRNN
ncbi:MAG TPA: ABC transporter permease [Methylomirabilota bacterium]|nr:ABC transporter permease [Methylomirabilota bacterium]